MTLPETLEQLKALGNEKVRAHNTKYGAGGNQFGVKLGDIRVLAKKIKTKDGSGRVLVLAQTDRDLYPVCEACCDHQLAVHGFDEFA